MVEQVDTRDLKSLASAYQFDSDYSHHGLLAELADAPDLGSGFSGFDSLVAHQLTDISSDW